MRIERKPEVYKPIVLTLETAEEARLVWLMLDFYGRATDGGVENNYITEAEAQVYRKRAQIMCEEYRIHFPWDRPRIGGKP